MCLSVIELRDDFSVFHLKSDGFDCSDVSCHIVYYLYFIRVLYHVLLCVKHEKPAGNDSLRVVISIRWS